MKPLFRSPKDQQTHSRSGIAFIVEMLILLVLVAGCLSVLVQAFAFAHQQGEENSVTVKAVHLASNTAERPEIEIVNDLAVYTTVQSEQKAAGTLYTATIEVYRSGDQNAGAGSQPYYGLETARYVKAGEM